MSNCHCSTFYVIDGADNSCFPLAAADSSAKYLLFFYLSSSAFLQKFGAQIISASAWHARERKWLSAPSTRDADILAHLIPVITVLSCRCSIVCLFFFFCWGRDGINEHDPEKGATTSNERLLPSPVTYCRDAGLRRGHQVHLWDWWDFVNACDGHRSVYCDEESKCSFEKGS